MPSNRKTLKNYFRTGALPTQSQFEDLVESSLNIMDDGFSRSAVNGVEVSLVGEHNRLLSFFRDAKLGCPDWALTCDKQSSSLNFVRTGAQQAENGSIQARDAENEVLTLTEDGRVGIGVSEPAFDLDVKGTVRSTGRFGQSGFVPADGDWHAITAKLDGCHALEVIAGVGLAGEKKGRYALLHAVVLNTFNPTGWFFNFLNGKKRIRGTQAWYLSRADRMKLRWVKANSTLSHGYQLELKTMSSYGDGTVVQYSITELWPDSFMEHSKVVRGGAIS
jgi:hypothetical protein